MAEKTYRFYIRRGDFELDVEGDKAFVKATTGKFAKEIEGDSAPAVSPATMPPVKRRAKGASAKREKTTSRKTAIPQVNAKQLTAFLKNKSQKSHKERFLNYMGFWALQGVPEVSANHVAACFETQGRAFPATGRQYFQILRNDGLAEKSGKWGFWTLTKEGQKVLEQGLGTRKAARKPVFVPNPISTKIGGESCASTRSRPSTRVC
ncbi:MAG: hypothetical protein P8018_04340 [Acidobacteriota bacterium]